MVIGQTLKVVKPLTLPPYTLAVGALVIARSTDGSRIALQLAPGVLVTLPALTTATQRASLSATL
jgi:hypothetical protein